jgi:hypothetical protein
MSWLKRVIDTFERAAMASAFAQVGEVDYAREIMKEGGGDGDGADREG